MRSYRPSSAPALNTAAKPRSSQVVKLLEDALGTDLRAPGFPEVLV
ncbi:MAG: hypothetical protein U0401_21880 [Anaerolineae bacterium]